MDPVTTLRLCDEILDFCEGWQPNKGGLSSSTLISAVQKSAEVPCVAGRVEGAPRDIQARVQSIREWVLKNQQVTSRQADVLLELARWLRQVSPLHRAHLKNRTRQTVNSF